jgi:hypothetical protein
MHKNTVGPTICPRHIRDGYAADEARSVNGG